MTLRWVDGFETYSDVSYVPTRYQLGIIGVSTFIQGRGGYGNAFYFQGVLNSNTSILITPSFTNQSTWIIGFGFLNLIENSVFEMLDIRDGTTTQIALWFDSVNHVFLVKDGLGNLLATCSTIINNGIWYYVEFNVTISATGSYAVRINEVLDPTANAINVNTRISSNSSADKFAFLKPSGWYNGYALDDIYILDNQGSVNNSYLGAIKTEAIIANGAGSSTQWTPSPNTLANYNAINGTNAGSYIQTSTLANEDLYTYNALKYLSSVNAVCVVIAGETSTAVGQYASAVVKSGSTTVLSSVETFSSLSPSYVSAIQELDPNTSLTWTVSGVNNAQYGVYLANISPCVGIVLATSSASGTTADHDFSVATATGTSIGLAVGFNTGIGNASGTSAANGVGVAL